MAALVNRRESFIYATTCPPTSRFSLQSGRCFSQRGLDGSAGGTSDREADTIPGDAYSRERSAAGRRARETYE